MDRWAKGRCAITPLMWFDWHSQTRNPTQELLAYGTDSLFHTRSLTHSLIRAWRWLSSGRLHHAVRQMLTDVSVVFTVSIGDVLMTKAVKYLWNVDQYLPDYTALYSRRQPCSYPSPRGRGTTHTLSLWNYKINLLNDKTLQQTTVWPR